MSNPYDPNQQPVNGDNNGQYSTEQQPTEQLPAVDYGQQPTEQLPAVNYGQQATQQMPAVGGYGQQATQQMPAVGGYGQQATQQMPAVNYGQQATQQMPAAGGYGQAQPGYAQQQGYYPPGQFPASPYGGQPKKKGPNTGLIIGAIAAVIVVILIAVIAIIALNRGDSSDDSSASPSASPTTSTSTTPSASPSSTSHPSTSSSSKPTPSQSSPSSSASSKPTPSQSASSSSTVSVDEEYGVKSECKNAMTQFVQQGKLENWTVERDGVNSKGEKQYISKGQINGTLITGETGIYNFTCTAVYHQDSGLYEAWSTIEHK